MFYIWVKIYFALVFNLLLTKMEDLHKNQISIFRLLQENSDSPLTIRKIQSMLDFSSPSVVLHHIQKLESKGYIKRNPSNPRDYQLFQSPERPIVYINHYGYAQCGKNGTFLDGNPIDRIPVASKLLKFLTSEAFMVKAKGNSMEPRIKEGDLVIAQKSKVAANDDIVVCVFENEVLIKQYFKKDNTVTLISMNSKEHPPIIVHENLNIEGVVKNVLTYS